MKKYFTNQLQMITLILIPIAFGLFTGLKFLSMVSLNEFNEIYLMIWERGVSGFFIVLFLICLTQFALSDIFFEGYSGMSKNVITRVGYKKYYTFSMKRIIFRSFLYTLTVHLLLIILLNLFHSFTFEYAEYVQHIYFSKNTYINISIFVLLSSLGSIVYCLAIFPFLYFIKNPYLFRILGSLIFFGSVIITFLVNPVILNSFGDTELIRTISLCFIPTSLIEPGCGWYSFAVYDFLAGFIVYILLFILGMILLCNYRGCKDD